MDSELGFRRLLDKVRLLETFGQGPLIDVYAMTGPHFLFPSDP